MPHFSGEIGQRYRILMRPEQGPVDLNRYQGSATYAGTYPGTSGNSLLHKFIGATYYSNATGTGTGQVYSAASLPFLDSEFRENGGKYIAIKENPESKEVMSGGRRQRHRATRRRHTRKRRTTRTRRSH